MAENNSRKAGYTWLAEQEEMTPSGGTQFFQKYKKEQKEWNWYEQVRWQYGNICERYNYVFAFNPGWNGILAGINRAPVSHDDSQLPQ